MSRALTAFARVTWWRLVLAVAPLDRLVTGQEWSHYIDARWLLYLAQADLRDALEGRR